ncbi:MFS transporter [uncultured Clostridium sp.]|uniref:MFS transporter n=1 Tax=uncultured Clostridium sp. TaxID=59620 RepID=UPI00262FF744|nr:MFS transporter [uncultured Clostridium sp.]
MKIKENILFKKKELFRFCSLRFLFGISYSFMIPIIPLFFNSIGIGTLVIGTIMSLYGVAKAIAQIPFGIISDSIGDKILWIGALVLMTIVPLSYIFIKIQIGAKITYIIQGAVLGMAAPATFSVLSRSLDERKRGECTGYASAVFTLGGGIGAIIGGFVSAYFNSYALAFILASIGIFLSLLYLIFKIEKPTKIMTKCKESKEPLSCRIKVIYSEIKEHKLLARIIVLSAVALLGDFIYGCVVSMFPFYGQEVLGGTAFYTSCIISIYLFVFGLFAPLGGVVSDKIGVKKQLYASFIVMLITLFLLWIIKAKILFTVVIFFYFLGATFLNSALQNSLLEFGENENIKGIVFGIIGASESIGYSIGPIVAAFIYHINKGFLFMGLLIFSIIIFIMFIILSKRAFSENIRIK